MQTGSGRDEGAPYLWQRGVIRPGLGNKWIPASSVLSFQAVTALSPPRTTSPLEPSPMTKNSRIINKIQCINCCEPLKMARESALIAVPNKVFNQIKAERSVHSWLSRKSFCQPGKKQPAISITLGAERIRLLCLNSLTALTPAISANEPTN